MKKFKIGDAVVLVHRVDVMRGCVGIIVKPEKYPQHINVDLNFHNNPPYCLGVYRDRYSWCVSEGDLEHYE